MSTYSAGHYEPETGIGWKVFAVFGGFLIPFVIAIGAWLAVSAHVRAPAPFCPPKVGSSKMVPTCRAYQAKSSGLAAPFVPVGALAEGCAE